MSTSHAPISVAILAFPETTASVTYGLYDLFMAVGRDWGFVVNGQPGPALVHPRIVSARAGAFTAANDVPIAPQATLDERTDARIVCVPELAVPPGEPLTGRFARRDRVAQAVLCARRHPRHGLLRGGAPCRGRPAGRSGGNDPLGLLRHPAQPLSDGESAKGTRPGGVGRRAAPHHGWRWYLVAGSGAVPHRALRRCGCRDASRAHQPHRLAHHRATAVRTARSLTAGERRSDRALSDVDRRAL